MNMMEIRAKCRRLKQRNDLKFVIIDYLQLMSSPKRVENRQQEVSDMSRSLKLLAKELDVPVIALSQLNRGPEQRTDKKPLLSDLRESGCMTEDTALLRADTGAPVTFGELMRDGGEECSSGRSTTSTSWFLPRSPRSSRRERRRCTGCGWRRAGGEGIGQPSVPDLLRLDSAGRTAHR